MKRMPKTLGEPVPRPALGRPVVAVLDAVLANSEAMLKGRVWQTPTERIIYWAGVKLDHVWLVTTVIRPNAMLQRGSFRTSAADNAKVVSYLSQAGLSLAGQVHTHPGPFVDHSHGDERDAFMPVENSLSLVVPFYGRGGIVPVSKCGVHRYESGAYRRLGDAEVASTFCVVSSMADFAT
ncbi:Mov34/MPN/PAD-1 family protein [Burkholderia cepacia]|uniref:Mov34/MPN/PAD-1 family protein n=1 Tax=Burkholderia cepacia TaxID=292 RepID=UPI000F5DB2B7|nr:Mov34/MPN/PAD-1 family protein [Burkholderia cepacia]RQT22759.1 hypothetical protein DF135_36365 [Burkholderia cepacia]